MAMPCFGGYFENGNKDAERRNETFGALPVLFVAFHAVLEFGEAAAVAITYQAVHLRFEDRKVAEDLCFEFIHHAHGVDSGG
jgi:hypothetical protein